MESAHQPHQYSGRMQTAKHVAVKVLEDVAGTIADGQHLLLVVWAAFLEANGFMIQR